MDKNFVLTPWQKKQATLLYHFASLSYLKGLKEKVFALSRISDEVLAESREQDRDKFLRSTRWGERNTSENWANNAWQFLADFRISVLNDIASRGSQVYRVTGSNQCGRGLAEFSMAWATPEEQERFKKKFEEISIYSYAIDKTMDRSESSSAWTDFDFAMAWDENVDLFARIPKLHVLTEKIVESGSIPWRTGVYVSSDDPDASLQFAWDGDSYGELLEASTFNELGRDALGFVGRDRLWIDGDAMLDFVKNNLTRPELMRDSFLNGSLTPRLAPSLVARQCFCSCPSRWYYVEASTNEFEDMDEVSFRTVPNVERFEAGQTCTRKGWYLTPAHGNSRQWFEVGQVFLDLNSSYGKTIWQWIDSEK